MKFFLSLLTSEIALGVEVLVNDAVRIMPIISLRLLRFDWVKKINPSYDSGTKYGGGLQEI